MKVGKLRLIENKEKSSGESLHYHHVLVIGTGGLETLIMTDRELDSIRQRTRKNPEDVAKLGLLDKLYAWFISLF